MTAQQAPIAPVDPNSPRGRQLAAALTVALDDVEEAINRRKAAAKRAPADAA